MVLTTRTLPWLVSDFSRTPIDQDALPYQTYSKPTTSSSVVTPKPKQIPNKSTVKKVPKQPTVRTSSTSSTVQIQSINQAPKPKPVKKQTKVQPIPSLPLSVAPTTSAVSTSSSIPSTFPQQPSVSSPQSSQSLPFSPPKVIFSKPSTKPPSKPSSPQVSKQVPSSSRPTQPSSKSSSKPTGSSKPLRNVVFAISAITNPQRAELRSKAINLGAKYSPDVTSSVTHLVLPIANTPKYFDAQALNVLYFVTPEWIEACFDEKRRVPEFEFKLPTESDVSSDSSGDMSGSDQDSYESDFVVD
ncbi:hypothetical protein GEMRC1_003765 [Eukaryota sp. GEM-RC1]